MFNYNLRVGGEAGQGIQTIGFILAKVFLRNGIHVFASQDYESRIRGGHNFFHLRISDKPVLGTSNKVDLLIALNKETVTIHKKYLTEKVVILFDGEKTAIFSKKISKIDVPLERIAKETLGDKIFSNTVAIGAVIRLLNINFQLLSKLLEESFNKKGNEVVENNIMAAKKGFEYIDKNYREKIQSFIESDQTSRRMLISGNEAIALGSIASGCKFMSSYPMTPSTGIMQYMLNKMDDYNLIVEQAEDEISAINMAIGASFAGVRSMTATSGGGFSLMVEGLSLSGMTETPIVIVLGQRPGPATGFPTRTEQGELGFTIHAAHGEFARVILAPINAEDAFYLMNKAFNIAEKYQIPVIVLTDEYLADSYYTVNELDFSKIIIDRGNLLLEDEASKIKDYVRHNFTRSRISPRALPGYSGILVITDSDEHDESGHITESAKIRTKMVEKRVWKTKKLAIEFKTLSYGSKKSEIVFLGWGSTYGAIREAIDILNYKGFNIRMLHFNFLWPFPKKKVIKELKDSKERYVIENNATSQLARLIQSETGIEITSKILKYDGRPMTSEYIINAFTKGRY